MRHRPRHIRWLAGGLAAMVSLAATILLGEGLARLLHEPQPVRRVYHPFAWRIAQPDLTDVFRNAEGELVRVELNELGLRGPSLARPVPPETLTLVFLGGSAVENYGWPDADTFPVLVGAEIERRLRRPVRVLNGGTSAAASGTTLGRLQHQVIDVRPSMVVVMDGINDLLGGFHASFAADGRHLPRPAVAGARPRSYLLDWLRTLPPPRSRPPRAAPRELRRLDYDDFPARQVFARNLRSMAAIAEAHGVPILFVTQPTTYSASPDAEDRRRYYLTESLIDAGMVPPDIPSLAAGMRAFNSTVLALPTSRLVHTFDLAARMPRSYELFIDECHLTRAGNRRVAGELAPAIEALLQAQAGAAETSVSEDAQPRLR